GVRSAAFRPPAPTRPLHAAPAAPFSSLSLHDALPIFAVFGSDDEGFLAVPMLSCREDTRLLRDERSKFPQDRRLDRLRNADDGRSEEHTSELQSRENLVCRLLLEKKKAPAPRSPDCDA